MKLDYSTEADATAAIVPVLSRHATTDEQSILESEHKVEICHCFKSLTIEFLLEEENSCVFKCARLYTYKILLGKMMIGKRLV